MFDLIKKSLHSGLISTLKPTGEPSSRFFRAPSRQVLSSQAAPSGDFQLILQAELDELLQPRCLALDDPIESITAGGAAFISQAPNDPAWDALVVRGAAAMPPYLVGVTHKRLNECPRRMLHCSTGTYPPTSDLITGRRHAGALGDLGSVAGQGCCRDFPTLLAQTAACALTGR